MLSLDVENVRNEWFVCGVLYAKSSIKAKKKNEMLNYGLDTNEVVLKQFAFNCVFFALKVFCWIFLNI